MNKHPLLLQKMRMQQVELPTTGNEQAFEECKFKIVRPARLASRLLESPLEWDVSIDWKGHLGLVEISSDFEVIRDWRPLYMGCKESQILIRDLKTERNVMLLYFERAMKPTKKNDDTFEYWTPKEHEGRLLVKTGLHQPMRSSELDQKEIPEYYQKKIPTAGNEDVFQMCGIKIIRDGVIQYPTRLRFVLPTKVNNIANFYFYEGTKLRICIMFGKAYYYL